MNILLTLNKKYLPYMISLIRSINDNNTCLFDFYIFSNDIKICDIEKYQSVLSTNNKYHIISINKNDFKDAPITSRYPYEMYYRIFASKYLPAHLERILYLDPDIIVKGDLSSIYNLDLKNNYYAACSNVKKILKRFNQIKNGASKDCEYVNTGVLLMNLTLLRKHQKERDVYNFIEQRKHLLTLPDQDIISTLYGNKIMILDRLIYNLSERAIIAHNLLVNRNEEIIDLKWIEENTVIIHYLGRNKPWKENYHGILGNYYKKYQVDKN